MQTLEFACQYSDQVRKKHKAWHDGKLKVVRSSKRLQLYCLEGKKLLSSTIVTSDKDLERLLNADEFGKTEHHVFGKYVVIVEADETAAERPPARPAPRITIQRSRSSGDPLALKMNKPFKPPRATTAANRPSVRGKVVREARPTRARIRRVTPRPIML